VAAQLADQQGLTEPGAVHRARPVRHDGAVSETDAPAVPIRDAAIRLGQFLKLANLLESGAEAKLVIADGEVSVNGEVELRRGRQLRDGDVVSVFGQAARVEGP